MHVHVCVAFLINTQCTHPAWLPGPAGTSTTTRARWSTAAGGCAVVCMDVCMYVCVCCVGPAGREHEALDASDKVRRRRRTPSHRTKRAAVQKTRRANSRCSRPIQRLLDEKEFWLGRNEVCGKKGNTSTAAPFARRPTSAAVLLQSHRLGFRSKQAAAGTKRPAICPRNTATDRSKDPQDREKVT